MISYDHDITDHVSLLKILNSESIWGVGKVLRDNFYIGMWREKKTSFIRGDC